MKKGIGILFLVFVVMFGFIGCASKAPCTGQFVAVPAVADAPAPKAVAPAPIVKAAPAPIVIYFDFDKSTLKASEQPKIDEAVKLLKADPTAVVQLDGHTDPIGADKYNLKLSEKRANVVKAALLAKGIDSKRISTIAYGETRLDKPGLKGKAANAPNRRTVVVIKFK
jgi:OmpA-OmpF porin, OOP family